eukprot:Sdes_comp20113_c0_seq1m13139
MDTFTWAIYSSECYLLGKAGTQNCLGTSGCILCRIPDMNNNPVANITCPPCVKLMVLYELSLIRKVTDYAEDEYNVLDYNIALEICVPFASMLLVATIVGFIVRRSIKNGQKMGGIH